MFPHFEERGEPNVQVTVRDNNVDQALRALKKKMQREGIFREMKLRRSYEKPSEKRAREKAEAVRRATIVLVAQAQAVGFDLDDWRQTEAIRAWRRRNSLSSTNSVNELDLTSSGNTGHPHNSHTH